MAGISHPVCVNNAIRETGTFHDPGELWDVMKRNLRQLAVDADAEAVAWLAILLAHDFPSFAERALGSPVASSSWIYCHGGDVLNTFHECIRSWIMRGIYSPALWQEVVQREATWSRRARMFQRPLDEYNSFAENSPDVLDLVWVGIAWALPSDSRYRIDPNSFKQKRLERSVRQAADQGVAIEKVKLCHPKIKGGSELPDTPLYIYVDTEISGRLAE